MEAQTENAESTEPTKTKKPSESRFCQQRLPAWKPMLTAKTVFPYFYSAGVVMIVLGAVLLTTSNNVQEFSLDYTNCPSVTPDFNGTCADVVKNYDYVNKPGTYPKCKCSLNFTISQDFAGPVFLYYGLTNFYQNHRYYVRSRDDQQLLGQSLTTLNSNCDPYRVNNESKQYAPCGAIANSLFNDTFSLALNNNPISMTSEGIAWYTDKTKKYGVVTNWTNTVKPPNWQKSALERSNKSYAGDEELLVWMRPAALPNFRKLHRIISNGLVQGQYSMTIDYNYPVTGFGGTKTFVLSTTSWIGGKNPRLGIAYLVVGCVHVVLGVIFTVLHFKFKLEVDVYPNQGPRVSVTPKSNATNVEITGGPLLVHA